jgi:hypothetical protein
MISALSPVLEAEQRNALMLQAAHLCTVAIDLQHSNTRENHNKHQAISSTKNMVC